MADAPAIENDTNVDNNEESTKLDDNEQITQQSVMEENTRLEDVSIEVDIEELPVREGSRLKDFMHELIITDTQLQEIYDRITGETQKGLTKKTHSKSEIKCKPTYVMDFPDGKETGKFIGMQLGSDIKIVFVSLNGDQENYPMESETYELSHEIMSGSGEELFDFSAKCLEDFIQKKEIVLEENMPLCFSCSFAYTQKNLTKGIVSHLSNSSGIINKDIKEMLKEAIARCTSLKIDIIAIINNTTSCLISGAHRNPDCRVGLIIDTGCNICYVEKVENIELLDEECIFKDYMIVNTELSAFGNKGNLDFIRTEFDQTIDKMSINKGYQIFEKMVAGMYLGELVRLVLIRAVRENLMFTDCAIKKKVADILYKKVGCFEVSHLSEIDADVAPEYEKTREIIKVIFELRSKYIFEEDCEKLKFVCKTIAKRSGHLIGVALSSLINRMEFPHVVVSVDGTAYKSHQNLASYIQETMTKLVSPEITFELVQCDSEQGAAILGAVIENVKRNNKKRYSQM